MNQENNTNSQIPVSNNVPVNNDTVGYNNMSNSSTSVNTTQPVGNTQSTYTTVSNNNSLPTNGIVSTVAVGQVNQVNGGGAGSQPATVQVPLQGATQGPVQASVQSATQAPVTQVAPQTSSPVQEAVSYESLEEKKEEKVVENSDVKHEVAEVLSINGKEKVNLLTSEQKAELTRKREAAMKEKENYQPVPVSKFKRFMAGAFIVLLLLIVMFLPEINSYVVTIMSRGDNGSDNTIITTGTLKCVNDRVDQKYNISYSYVFDFTDSKLNKLTYVEATVGDEFVDSDDLNARLERCKNLKGVTSDVSGINVVCSLSGGTLTREQTFNYSAIDVEAASSAYVEAGGEYPGEFQNEANIDSIEKNMKAAGYTCDRYR